MAVAWSPLAGAFFAMPARLAHRTRCPERLGRRPLRSKPPLRHVFAPGPPMGFVFFVSLGANGPRTNRAAEDK
jgi:hypothetical protein